MSFNKGDILIGTKREFEEAYHPIIFIEGSDLAPLAVVLTHSGNFPCNLKLSGKYDERASHSVAHLIEKVVDWGPYEKIGEITKEDLDFIEEKIQNAVPITWNQYEEYTKGECPDHGGV